jgi:hypothetical protein
MERDKNQGRNQRIREHNSNTTNQRNKKLVLQKIYKINKP